MWIRDIVGTTIAGLVAATVALAPGAFLVPTPGTTALASDSSWAVRGSNQPGTVVVHPCPATSESECRAVFLPPVASNDGDGAAHTSHAPQVRICGPLDDGVSWQSVSSCDDPGTGEQVEFFPFSCGDVKECVEVRPNHYQANWKTSASGCEEEDGDGDDEEGDEDECEEDDEDEDEDEDEDSGKGKGKGKGKGGEAGDADDDDDGEAGGEGIENGYYLINVRLNGNSAGGVVVEIGQGGGRGTPPKFNNGSTIPIRFRLHDKIVG